MDIWVFGCLVYEFLTGEALFTVMPGGNVDETEQADEDHLIQMNDKRRPLPERITEERPSTTSEHNSPHAVGPYEMLEQRFAKRRHPGINDEETATVCQLIREILVYDQAERPSAEHLLKHPWFAEYTEGLQHTP
jgi:serine/threonine protein kinase